ncbi:MAG: PilZ domain-containing protein [Proteobacteria bacterium]|nr:PilZ domain-containing protein [Pseudomonadota bacterium]
MEEQRGQERRRLSATTEVALDATGESIDAVLLNISSYGACFNTSHHLKNADMVVLKLKVNVPECIIESEELLCTVRWVERDGGVFTAGISFDMKIKEETHPSFTKCLEYTQVRI